MHIFNRWFSSGSREAWTPLCVCSRLKLMFDTEGDVEVQKTKMHRENLISHFMNTCTPGLFLQLQEVLHQAKRHFYIWMRRYWSFLTLCKRENKYVSLHQRRSCDWNMQKVTRYLYFVNSTCTSVKISGICTFLEYFIFQLFTFPPYIFAEIKI